MHQFRILCRIRRHLEARLLKQKNVQAENNTVEKKLQYCLLTVWLGGMERAHWSVLLPMRSRGPRAPGSLHKQLEADTVLFHGFSLEGQDIMVDT